MHPIETPKSKTTKTKPKTKFETIIIEYKNIKYEIIIDKLLCLIRILKNKKRSYNQKRRFNLEASCIWHKSAIFRRCCRKNCKD